MPLQLHEKRYPEGEGFLIQSSDEVGVDLGLFLGNTIYQLGMTFTCLVMEI